jgi:NAD(P)-dependent dehydrogenase (short-subunit alcohol dehydrogenase family)
MFSLEGKVALVTGAGQGMGTGVARALAVQGAAVAVNDLDEARAGEAAEALAADGLRAVPAAFDVTDAAAVSAGIAAVEAELGPVDVLVNNAGVPAAGFPLTPFKDMDPDLWTRFIDLNLYGVLHCTRAVLEGMCERGWGRIITVSSEAGRIGIPIGVSLYGAGKAAAVGFQRHLAVEVAAHGVTVNAVSLGLMDNVPGDFADKIARTVPRKRLGSPADVGAAVAFLASPEADWITGQVLPLNGGVATT